MKNLKILFTALLLLCCVGTAKAEEVTIDGIKYDVVTKAKRATVIKGGNYSGEIVIPSEITYNNVVYSVTSIGDNAFYSCSGLTSITIPNSVTSIGNDAFCCCTGLKSIVIGNSVTSIGDNAFYACTGLTSIVIPNCVTSIGIGAFYTCTGLTSIVIPNCVTSIGDAAFFDCTSLTSVEFNAENCTVMGSSSFPVFGNCDRLSTVTIGENVKSIPSYAFKYCTGLTSVVIPNSVTSIGGSAFYGCSGLTSVVILNSVTSIGESAFYNCIGLTSVTIPNSVTSIEYAAFYGCTGLTSITIPNSVTSIGREAFYDYEGRGVFEGCTGLTSVTIGTGVKYIYSKAFAKCSNLTDVYCLATSVPETDSYAFYESFPEYMTLHVPEEAIDSYKATAPWSSFGTIVTLNGGDYTNVINVPAKAVLVTSSNGSININCSLDGESVAVYTTAGTLIATTAIENGAAIVATGLSKGSVAIVNIAGKSIKVAVN